jgi:hypothetical protein
VASALWTSLRRRLGAWTVAYAVAPLASFLPFAYGLAAGGCFYFRDLAFYFFPMRRFVVEGLRAGEILGWNPYVNEGIPLLLPPVSYPLDLLQALVPNEWGFSLLLALHVPLAALTFLGLARRLGCGPAAATLGALVYALSGFSLSCVNLYIQVEAFAWAPFVISMLIRAAAGGGREVAAAGAAVALCLSTMGVEIAAQAIACGWLLSTSRRISGQLRLGGSVLLGIGLAASPLVTLGRLVSASRRAAGLAESLDYSVHPVSWLQTVIAGLYGDPISAGLSYWGTRFWGGPTPHFLSLYVGGSVVCLVAIGVTRAERYRTRLLLLLVAGITICLGSWARLDLLLALVPGLARFRFPVKAFFTVVVASSLLASLAAQRLAASRRAWWPLAVGATALGLGLLALPFAETLIPGRFAWLQGHFFVDAYPQGLRAAALRAVGADAAAGALALLAVAGLAALRLRDRISPDVATAAAATIIAADLLRAGAGLNPTASPSLYAFSPEMTRVSARLRQAGGRAFTCSIFAMPAFRDAFNRYVGPAGLWTVGVARESLTPYANMDIGIPTTGADATALVSSEHSLSTREAMCRDPQTLERLRESGVRYILSVQPFTNDALRLIDVASPARTAPLSIYVYELARNLPDPTVWLSPDDVDPQGLGHALDGAVARYADAGPGLVRIVVEAPREAYLILRRANAAGWSATVNGKPAAVLTANGRHQAVAIPSGTSDVTLRYRAPNGWLGMTLSLLSAGAVAALWFRSSGDEEPAAGPPAS